MAKRQPTPRVLSGESSRSDQTRMQIVEAAHKLFLAHGFHGASMRQIADEAGIAVGGIYNHFDGKESVFQAVLDAYHPYRDMLPILLQAEGDSVEVYVRNAARGLVEVLGRRPDFLNLMFIEIVEFRSQHLPGLFASIFPQVIPVVQSFAGKQGSLRPIPAPVLMRAFLGFFFSYFITEIFLVDGHFPAALKENALDHFVNIFLHGILADDSH